MKGVEKGISARYSVRSSGQEPSQSTDTKQAGQPYKQLPRCYICNSPTHLATDCRTKRSESEGRLRFTKKTNIVHSSNQSDDSSPGESHFQEVVEILFPSALTTIQF